VSYEGGEMLIRGKRDKIEKYRSRLDMNVICAGRRGVNLRREVRVMNQKKGVGLRASVSTCVDFGYTDARGGQRMETGLRIQVTRYRRWGKEAPADYGRFIQAESDG